MLKLFNMYASYMIFTVFATYLSVFQFPKNVFLFTNPYSSYIINYALNVGFRITTRFIL